MIDKRPVAGFIIRPYPPGMAPNEERVNVTIVFGNENIKAVYHYDSTTHYEGCVIPQLITLCQKRRVVPPQMANLIKFTPGFVFLMDPFAPEGSFFSFTRSTCEVCGKSFRVCDKNPAQCKEMLAMKTKPVENKYIGTALDDVD